MPEISAAIRVAGEAREVVQYSVSRALPDSGSGVGVGVPGAMMAASGSATLVDQTDTSIVQRPSPFNLRGESSWPPFVNDQVQLDTVLDGVASRRLTGAVDQVRGGGGGSIDVTVTDPLPGSAGEKVTIGTLADVPPCSHPLPCGAPRGPRIEGYLDRAMLAMGFFSGFRHGRMVAMGQRFQGDVEVYDYGRRQPQSLTADGVGLGVKHLIVRHHNGAIRRRFEPHPTAACLVAVPHTNVTVFNPNTSQTCAPTDANRELAYDFGLAGTESPWFGKTIQYHGPSLHTWEIAALAQFDASWESGCRLRFDTLGFSTDSSGTLAVHQTVHIGWASASGDWTSDGGSGRLRADITTTAGTVTLLSTARPKVQSLPIRVSVHAGIARLYLGDTVLASAGINHPTYTGEFNHARWVRVGMLGGAKPGPVIYGMPEADAAAPAERRAYLGRHNAYVYPSTDADWVNHYYLARPGFADYPAMKLFREITEIVHASTWVDEDGNLVWAGADMVANNRLKHLPAKRAITVEAELVDINWESNRSSRLAPNCVDVDIPSVQSNYGRAGYVDAFQTMAPAIKASDPTQQVLIPNTPWETLITPRSDETWLGFPETMWLGDTPFQVGDGITVPIDAYSPSLGGQVRWSGTPRYQPGGGQWFVSGFDIVYPRGDPNGLGNDVINSVPTTGPNVLYQLSAIDDQTAKVVLTGNYLAPPGTKYVTKMPKGRTVLGVLDGAATPWVNVPMIVRWKKQRSVNAWIGVGAAAGITPRPIEGGKWLPGTLGLHVLRLWEGLEIFSEGTSAANADRGALLKDVPIVFDPTLRLGQHVELVDNVMYSARINGVIVGINESVAHGRVSMSLQVRIIGQPVPLTTAPPILGRMAASRMAVAEPEPQVIREIPAASIRQPDGTWVTTETRYSVA